VNCDRKRVFGSEKAAAAELKRMKREVIDPFRLNVYRCERHNGWHIGAKSNGAIWRLMNHRRASAK